jgi:hypothetical protein
MIFGKTLLAVTITINVAVAQNLSHPLMAARADAFSYPRVLRNAADTVDVLAVMVQFQIDGDTRTTGNGQFDLSTPADLGLDSPPHNRRYFEDHLTFLANYYRRVSKNKTVIRATIVDSVFTLADQMPRYSPPKSGPNTVVGDLARDTWRKVDSSGRVPDFSRYECFVVFHAGVGRDVDLAATIGFDPTPLDIPSLYLGLNAFKSFYGQTYEGILVRNNFRITNTIIMPETETREIPATNVILRLGINGLLCASVGNFLGLPDLFNTNDGRSGIGRFGLMDGQSIFSFAGAFPPEPSAWEKYWLGWIQPIVVSSGERLLELPAASLADSIYRIPVSASEYFLVENRNRDWARNGQRVTISYNNTISQRSYQRDTVGFNAFNLTDIRGNIIDVDDFDWSLPGGVGATTNEFFDGGILIWHIDETVIAQGLPTNGVNANPNRRGVDLEEADGSQDIGQSYGQLEPGSGSEEGTALDFWFQGNIAPVYRNEFSATSYPNNASNGGANSHFAIRDISRRGARMTARVSVGDNITMLTGFPKHVPMKLSNPTLSVGNLGTPASLSIVVATTRDVPVRPNRNSNTTLGLTGELYAWRIDGAPVLRNELFARAGGPVPLPGAPFVGAPVIADFNSAGPLDVIIADANSSGGTLRAYQSSPNTLDSLALELFTQPLSKRPTTSPLITDSILALGASRATVYVFSRNGNLRDSISVPGDTSDVVGIVSVDNAQAIAFTTAAGRFSTNALGIVPPAAGLVAASFNGAVTPMAGEIGGKLTIVVAASDGKVFAPGIQASLNDIRAPIKRPMALADVDGDGNRDIIVFAQNKIHAFNYAGALLDNFPKQIPSTNSITSNPVVADVDGDGDVDIVAVSEDGLVTAYDKSGQMTRGFPLQAGIGNQSVAAFAVRDTVMLAVASSEDGAVAAWRTGVARGVPTIPWGQYQRDAQHTGLAIEPLTGTPLSSAFFPKDRAYNWPNPVTDGKTFIRYFVKENASVKIKIFDLAGDVVTEMSAPGVGGVDNEVEWNVGAVQSGIYLARIEASSGAKSETAIVKVAVVK